MENEPYVCKTRHVSHYVEAVSLILNIIHRNSWVLNHSYAFPTWKQNTLGSDPVTAQDNVTQITSLWLHRCERFSKSQDKSLYYRLFQIINPMQEHAALSPPQPPTLHCIFSLARDIHGHFPLRAKAYPSRLAVKPSSSGAVKAFRNKRVLYFPGFQW